MPGGGATERIPARHRSRASDVFIALVHAPRPLPINRMRDDSWIPDVATGEVAVAEPDDVPVRTFGESDLPYRIAEGGATAAPLIVASPPLKPGRVEPSTRPLRK